MTDLLHEQQDFALAVARLILKAPDFGFFVTFGEAQRTAEQAAIYAAEGKGIADSLHRERLAIDLNFFTLESEYVTDVTRLLGIGAWWLAQDSRHRWGGAWRDRTDANHFSLTPDQIRA